MRRGSKPEIVFDGGETLGVNLSYDFCAEHEGGIGRLKDSFGITGDISKYGMERRRITCSPDTVRWVRFTKDKLRHEGFIFREYFYEDDADAIARTSSELRIWRPTRGTKDYVPPTLAAAWSDRDFGVVSTDREQVARLREIFNEFPKNNIVIMLGAREPFGNSGLVLGIADRIPRKYLDMWHGADKDWHAVRTEVDASGIEYLLRQAKCGYYALSPRRQPDGTIKFWLNPMQQDRNNYGWFTFEELRQWAKGEGPIPMKNYEKTKPRP